MVKEENKQEVKEETQQVTVEQVAQRMQILQFEIKQRQTEYNQLHDAWMKAMTQKPQAEEKASETEEVKEEK